MRWLGLVPAAAAAGVIRVIAVAGALAKPVESVPEITAAAVARLRCCIVAVSEIRENVLTLERVGYLVTHPRSEMLVQPSPSQRRSVVCIRFQESGRVQQPCETECHSVRRLRHHWESSNRGRLERPETLKEVTIRGLG